MSVMLIIYDQNGDKLIPIAGQKTFEDFWIPICEKEKLEWVPLFENGTEFTEEDLPYILNELYIMKKSKFVEAISDRLNTLILNLETLKDKKISFFIG